MTSGKLNGYLVDLDKQAEDMFFRLVKQMAEREGVTEQLKADNQMEWVGRMNNIRNRVTEVVNHDIIYNQHLEESNAIDFADMINKAADIVASGHKVHSYKWIIIDEYQDISVARYKLVQAILNQTGAKLLCVGDDWQSICPAVLLLFLPYSR